MPKPTLVMIDTWLLALANVSVFCLLIGLGLDELLGDGIWQLGYLSGSVFCFAFWLALGTVKWWHRAGQALLVASASLITVWLEQRPSGSWLLLLATGTMVFAVLRVFRFRVSRDDFDSSNEWRWSIMDLLVMTGVTGLTYKFWEVEVTFGPGMRLAWWEAVWQEIEAYGVLASHGGLLILPALWLLLRRRLSGRATAAAITATIVIAAIVCWLVPVFLNGRWVTPTADLWEFWLEYVWHPQLVLVTVAVVNGLIWRWLGFRLIKKHSRPSSRQ